MSVKSNPSTSSQLAGSNSSETTKRELKGQNRVVIDWLVSDDATGVFAVGPDGSVGYEEIRRAITAGRTGQVAVLTPERNVASVLEIYTSVGRGPIALGGAAAPTGAPVSVDVMTVLGTSGTTGAPKLVPLTAANWKAAVEASATHLGHTADDEWLVAMPLHHVGGLSVLFRSSHVGGRVRLLADFDPVEFSDALGVVTMASVVPTMLRRVLDVDRRRFDGLKAVLVGGGPIPPGLLEEAWERGIPALPTYGMTETCAQVATLRPGSPPAYRAHLLPGLEARTSQDGRISVRGPQVFTGYLGEESVLVDGWFLTGDLGEVLEDGSLQITGRADDVIVTGGENVDPSIVEVTIASHPGVTGAMVVGVPSVEWGSEVVCLVTGDVPVRSLELYVRERLKPFEVPKHWLVVSELPTTALGKPDRETGRRIAVRGSAPPRDEDSLT